MPEAEMLPEESMYNLPRTSEELPAIVREFFASVDVVAPSPKTPLPITVNASDGPVVPIPKYPLGFKRIFSFEPILKCIPALPVPASISKSALLEK